ncbi:hypothetical protein IRJ41_018616 [Triplophysa rosa]|uniref:Uncharacterized protein n=1 Tax=Triplophysa rosa TaxID=992332 RepID=A0A9W8CBC1_TRIRA|nr:hypothetical protein IRJ41_018616 [Triplophysa rosa]
MVGKAPTDAAQHPCFPIRVCVRERQRARLKGVADADKSHAGGKPTEPSLYRTSEVRLYIPQDLYFISPAGKMERDIRHPHI